VDDLQILSAFAAGGAADVNNKQLEQIVHCHGRGMEIGIRVS
jgi:hypothetical protein